METTANHLPNKSSVLVRGRLNSDSRVPRSRSPTVISMAGCTAALAVHMARTNGINKERSIPACSPFVATSASEMEPSHCRGLSVDSTSRPADSIRSARRSSSQSMRTSKIRLLASLDCSDVDRCRIA